MNGSLRLRTRRVGTVITAAVFLAAGLSGCSYLSPDAVAEINNVADGVNGAAPEGKPVVLLRDVLLLQDEGATKGTLVGAVVNTTSADVPVQLTVSAGAGEGAKEVGKVKLTAKAGGVTKLETLPDATLAGLSSKPGELLTLVAQTPTGGSSPLTLPVLSAKDFTYYQTTSK